MKRGIICYTRISRWAARLHVRVVRFEASIPRGAAGVAVILAGALVTQGCDPGWDLSVRNNSDRTLLVAVDNGDRTVYYVPPHAAGFTYANGGIDHHGVTVLDTSCKVLASLATGDAGSFLLTIPRYGAPIVAPSDNQADTKGLRSLSEICGGSASCEGATTPWPTGIPKRPSDLDFCDGG